VGKGIRTVFFSIGTSSSCLSELEIAEIIGCPINIIYTNESQVKQWEEVKACLKTHKPPNDPISTFSEKSQEKWVLPKNVRILSEWKSGNVLSIVQDACKSMSISEGDARIDILKIDLNGGAECRTLYEVLDAGFRPALIIIRWTQEPDSHAGVRLAAGNLQNCGYALLKKEGNKYLYYYVDNDMYSTCSWQIEGSINPLVDAVIQQVLCEVTQKSSNDKNTAVFTNDNHVKISLLDHPLSQDLKRRDNHEVLFRRINTFLIENKVIKNSIIDLGAWIGDNTIPWAKNIDGTVFAIDPSPNNCEFIYKTCQLNNITNVKILQSAISNKKEILTTNDNIDHCSFVYGNPALNGRTRVDAVSLDYLFEVNAIDNIGYIHLDVEGMEYKILEGSSTLIDACRPLISFEQHLEIDDYAVILSYLQNKQYVIFLVDEVLPGCREDCRNSFAFPAEIYNETLIENINKYIGKNILVNMCTTSSSNIGNLIKNILLKRGVEKIVDINTVINTDAC
jgi:FkbM family methyltransferase